MAAQLKPCLPGALRDFPGGARATSLKTSALRPEQALPELLVPLRALLANVPPQPVRPRAGLGRRGCLCQPARERPRDEEPGNRQRFQQMEAARCYARA